MTLIIGKSVANAKQMATYLLSVNKTPMFYREISAEEFCQLFLDVCAKENVRGDLAFAQCLKETGNLKYGGDVSYEQNNFCGLGATGGVPGCSFPSIEIGILAQAQHLKTYATKAALNETCVDPRRTNWFVNAKGGTAPNIEDLGGTWAVPGYDTKKYSSLEDANKAKDSYGYQIVNILNKIIKIDIKEEKDMDNNLPVIALSAGHGLYTAGKQCDYRIDPSVTKEWYLNDRICDKVEYKLKAYKCKVVRVNDTTGKVDTPLATRANISDNANADVYIAMHHNAGIKCGSGGGTVVYYYSSKAERKTQAQALYNAIIAQTGLVGNRSSKVIKKNFYECRKPKAPAFLIENGYMDSVVDTPIILTDAHAEKTAIAVINFLVNMLKLEKSGVVVTGTVTSNKPSTLQSSQVTTYTVKVGDTLSGIGKKTGVDWKVIANLNGIKSPYILKVGQVLKIRETKISTTSSASTLNYELVFNATYYANTYADLKKAFGYNAEQLLNHFKKYGMKEHRRASANFDPVAYRNRYKDLDAAFGDDWAKYYEHYMTFGYKENRKAV